MNKENEELIITDWINKKNELRKQEVLQELTKHNFDVSLDFNFWQMEQISLGLKANLDVSIYAKPEFTDWQMREIGLGLRANLDVSKYTNPEYTWKEMKEIRLELLEESTLK